MKIHKVFEITFSVMPLLSPSPLTKRGVGAFFTFLRIHVQEMLFTKISISLQDHILHDDHHTPPPRGPRDGVSPLPAEHFDSFLQLFVLPISTQTSAIQYYHHYHLTLFCPFPLFDVTISTGASLFYIFLISISCKLSSYSS